MKRRFSIKIRGKVQGVGFRFSCMEAAYKYGIKGYVRNKPDGSVYAEAEGEEENLEYFIKWCKKGPLWARVKDIETEEIDIKNDQSFDIAH
ncbi:MAG: acylphosphatase [Bacteroidales bacterium]|nr:acylphosphatase [Bacteroidales bacterium]